jgi:hypothetical protein
VRAGSRRGSRPAPTRSSSGAGGPDALVGALREARIAAPGHKSDETDLTFYWLVDIEALRALVRLKLADGSLPMNSILRVWGGAGNGEICGVCGAIVNEDEFVMEGSAAADGKGIRLHVRCFSVWESERRRAVSQ